MVHDVDAAGEKRREHPDAARPIPLEFRDDLSAELRAALAPGSIILPASAPAHPIGESETEFLRSVLGPDWDRLVEVSRGDGPDRARLEALGPRDPRLALLWTEALVAVSRMLSETCTSVEDERSDARRLVTEILSDALGRRCAMAWLLDAWLRLCDEPSDNDVTESLRHAARLADAGSWVERQSILLLASLKLSRESAADAEITESIHGLPSGTARDTLRCASLIWHSGDSAQALRMVHSVLEDGPDIAVELLASQRYAPFAQEVRRFLHLLLDRTRGVVHVRSVAVAELHALCNQLAGDAGSPFVAIGETVDVPVDNLDLRTGRRLGVALAREWDETHREWSEKCAAELSRLRAELAKLERFLQNAYKERDYWAANVASVEEEARTHGYVLHAYGVFGWFQSKKRRRSEQMRAHYEQCKLNLDQAENLLRQQENRARFDIQNLGKRVELLEGYAQRLSGLVRPS